MDVTATGDKPESRPMAVTLGKGPAVKVKDSGMIAHPAVRDLMVQRAKEADIPYQLEILERGSTDAAAMQLVRAGVPAGCLSIPTRYLHTPSEMVDEEDVENSVKLLLEINELGLPAGTEMLDPITPQYLADLVSWASIGARTTESQTHREMASGLSMPVGFKNSTEGNLQVAIDAIKSARHPHGFLGIDQHGRTCVVRTNGNPWVHLVLRGGSGRPNYYPESIEEAAANLALKLREAKVL